jgi:hypothetical protein
MTANAYRFHSTRWAEELTSYVGRFGGEKLP